MRNIHTITTSSVVSIILVGFSQIPAKWKSSELVAGHAREQDRSENTDLDFARKEHIACQGNGHQKSVWEVQNKDSPYFCEDAYVIIVSLQQGVSLSDTFGIIIGQRLFFIFGALPEQELVD